MSRTEWSLSVFIPVHEGCGDKVTLNAPVNVTNDVTIDVTKELSERQRVIVEMVNKNSMVTIAEMSLKTGVTIRTIKRDINSLYDKGIIWREGGRKEGRWIIVNEKFIIH